MITAEQFIALSDRDQDKVAKVLTGMQIATLIADIEIMMVSRRVTAYSAQMRKEYAAAGEVPRGKQ